jgi:3-hydroxyanthranilate 3,4-dioxygenase
VRPLAAIDLKGWIDRHRDLLRPPVGNKVIWEDAEFIVMVVGGPNRRKDYHLDEGEELFYQLEGDIVLRVMQETGPADIPIRAGQVFLLPPLVPHSPQRPADTVGLVVERRRRPGERDGFRWYCEACHAMLYERFLEVTDIVKQLPPVFEEFFGSEAHRTCGRCGAVMARP